MNGAVCLTEVSDYYNTPFWNCLSKNYFGSKGHLLNEVATIIFRASPESLLLI